MKNSNILTLSLEIIMLLSTFFCNCGCKKESNYQTIPHNKLCGRTSCIHFSSVDTGYVITHIGELYDSIHCTYVYQTVDGGEYWEKVDSIPNFSFRKYSYAIHNDVVYGYVNNGTLIDEQWCSYLCLIDLKKHQHRVRDEAIYGPGKVFVRNDSIHFFVYKEKIKYILNLDNELSDVSYEKDTLPHRIKNISYNDSLLALITYDNKVHYFQSGQEREYSMDIPCDGILISGNDCYISFWGSKEYYGGVIRHDLLSGCFNTLDFPSGYKVVKFLKSSNDSVVILCTQEDIGLFCDDIVYSTDGGVWKKIHLIDPVIFPEYSSYCAPYLYIKSTFFDEIYKLRIK